METNEYGTAAEDVARNWFSRPTAKASAHITVTKGPGVCPGTLDTPTLTPPQPQSAPTLAVGALLVFHPRSRGAHAVNLLKKLRPSC